MDNAAVDAVDGSETADVSITPNEAAAADANFNPNPDDSVAEVCLIKKID